MNLSVLRRPSPEVLARAMALVQSIIEHKANSAGPGRRSQWWQKDLYPISEGGYTVRPGKPDVRSDEVQLLLASRLVSYIPTSSDDMIPDASLRLLESNEGKAREIIDRYIATLEDVTE